MDDNKEIEVIYDTKERNVIVLSILGSIFFFFLPALCVFLIYGRQKLSKFNYNAIVDLLNFEIYLTIIFLALYTRISFIPFFGWLLNFLLVPATFIFNLLTCFKAFKSFDKNEIYQYPISMPIIK